MLAMETSSPPSRTRAGSRSREHARRDRFKRLGHGGTALDVARALHHLADFFHVAAGFLNANQVWMIGQFNHEFGGNVVAGSLREVVNDHRQRRAVGHGSVEGQDIGRLHLLLVVMRRAHHGNVVAQFGGILGKAQRFDRRLDPRACDQNFVRRSRLARGFQHIAPLLIGKQNRLAGRAEHNNSSARRARIALNIAFELFEVDVAVGIERRRDGRKNTVK